MNLFNYLMARKGHNTSPRDDLFAYLLGKVPKVVKEVTGVTIHITDASREKIISLWLDKESSQKTTQGYNVFPYAPAETKTHNGITITSDGKGTYTINGKATDNAHITFDLTEEVTIPTSIGQGGNGKMYLFNNFINSNSSLNFYFNNVQVDYWSFSSINRINSTYSLLGNKKCNQIDIYVKKDEILSNAKFSVMITNDGDTNHNFEEFTGGEASPSPDYPQEINTVKGNVEITITDGINARNYTIPLGNNEIVGKGNNLDELIVDKFGKCYLKKVITKIDSYNGETITTEYMSTTGGLDIGATIYYVTPSQLIDLNYTIDLKLFKGENNISNSEDMMMTLKYY